MYKQHSSWNCYTSLLAGQMKFIFGIFDGMRVAYLPCNVAIHQYKGMLTATAQPFLTGKISARSCS